MKSLKMLKDYVKAEHRFGSLDRAHYLNIVDYINEAIVEFEALEAEATKAREVVRDLLYDIIKAQETIERIMEC